MATGAETGVNVVCAGFSCVPVMALAKRARVSVRMGFASVVCCDGQEC